MSGAITYKAFPGAPTGTPYEGEFATREDSPNGGAYIGKNGVWTQLLTTTSGGTVTLAGDVTGASNANTVVGLRGTAGVVAMHGTAITTDGVLSGAGISLSITAGTTSDSAAGGSLLLRSGHGLTEGDLSLRRGNASPFLIGQGSGGAELVQVRGGPTILLDADTLTLRTNAGVPKAIWTTTGIAFDAGQASVAITQDSAAGTGAVMSIFARSSSAAVGGNLILGSGSGGGGNLPGSVFFVTGVSTPALSILASSPQPIVHFHGNTVRWSETSTPFFSQAQRTTNSLPQLMRMRSQDPFNDPSTSGNNRIAASMHFEIGSSVNGADQLGHFEWLVAEELKMACWFDRTEMYGDIQMPRLDGTGAAIGIPDTNGPSDVGGASIEVAAGRGGAAGAGVVGGSVFLRAGLPSFGSGLAGGGIIGTIGSGGLTQFQAVQLGSVYLTALGCPTQLSVSDIQLLNSNYVLLGDAFNVDDVDSHTGPTNAVAIMSHGGKFLFQNASGDSIRFDGPFHSGPSGSSAGFFDIQINGSGGDYCIEVFNR